MYFGDLELYGHFDIFSLVYTEVVPGRVQQSIIDFTWPWDNFIVHGVNNPLVLDVISCHFGNFLGNTSYE